MGHYVGRVAAGQPERVRELAAALVGHGEFLQAGPVAELLEVRVVGRYATVYQKLHHACHRRGGGRSARVGRRRGDCDSRHTKRHGTVRVRATKVVS